MPLQYRVPCRCLAWPQLLVAVAACGNASTSVAKTEATPSLQARPYGGLLIVSPAPLGHGGGSQAHPGALVAADDFEAGTDAFAQGAHMADDANQAAALPQSVEFVHR